jgi:KUP system potassium uptake protein
MQAGHAPLIVSGRVQAYASAAATRGATSGHPMSYREDAGSSEDSPNDHSEPSALKPAAVPLPSSSRTFWLLALGSVGVVYGDIGTSPLYALKESLTAASAGGAVSPDAIFGVVSLILWALVGVVTIKYVFFLLYADNQGQGGILSLLALARQGLGAGGASILLLGIAGAALFYGDAIITPAISVLSAVEGLKVVTPALEPYILPVSLAVIVLLFASQRFGTAGISALFGPITVVWFVAMALGAIPHIVANPQIFAALNPAHGLTFLINSGLIGFLTLGAVFLAVTGAEALYADLGHFGRRPIQLAWIGLVFPALSINYIGQGAMLLETPENISSPFFLLYPAWATLPMVVLATLATVIASQAVITGAYSLTQQAMQLGLLPRFEVRQTSATQAGQVYLPRVNLLLLLLVMLTIGIFKTSTALAAAYGIAVTGTMIITSLLAFIVVWKCWRWPLWVTVIMLAPLLAIDTLFLSANLLKVHDGGWLPLFVGLSLALVMIVWVKGSRLLREKTARTDVPLASLLPSIEKRPPELRAAGTAVFLTAEPGTAPTALLHNLKHNKVVHERNVILSVVTEGVPHVGAEERVEVKPLSGTFTQITLRFGYMQSPNVMHALAGLRKAGMPFDVMQTSFFLSRRALRMDKRSALRPWQDQMFIALHASSDDAARYFGIPTDRVVEVGAQVSI